VLARLALQLGRFAGVGVGNTLLSVLAFAVLRRAGVTGAPAAALAFAAGAVNGYAWNRRWTFAAADTARARGRYVVVQLAGLGATSGAVAVLGRAPLPQLAAYLLTTAAVTLATFAAGRGWVFAEAHSDSTEAPQGAPTPRSDPVSMNTNTHPSTDVSPGAAPAVEIVVPVYDEEADLDRSVRRLHEYLERELPFTFRITIADNASRDRTWEIAQRLAGELEHVAAVHLDEKGRGRALRAVWSLSDAEVVAYMDVDLSTGLDALLPLVAPLLSGHSDVTIGSRLARTAHVQRSLLREVVSRAYNRILRLVLHARFSDAQCGFKAVRAVRVRELLPLVEDEAWFFDTELLVLAERAGLRIHEVPVDWVDDPDSRVDIVPTAIEDLRGVWRLLLHRRRLTLSDLRGEPHRPLAHLLRPDTDAPVVDLRPERRTNDLHAA
jgi:putative flippase GtrA